MILILFIINLKLKANKPKDNKQETVYNKCGDKTIYPQLNRNIIMNEQFDVKDKDPKLWHTWIEIN